MAIAFTLSDTTFRSSRHTTHYWGAGHAFARRAPGH